MGSRNRTPGQELIEVLWREAGIDDEYLTVITQALSPVEKCPNDRRNKLSLLALPQLCCQAAGGNNDDAFELAAAWELSYAAAHVFDALADGAHERGTSDFSVTLNVAAGLTVAMGQALCQLSNTAAAVEIQQTFFTYIVTMSAGQHRALRRRELSLEECWQLAEDRSGAFFAAACRLGARLGTDDAERLRWFEHFGRQIGILLQIGNELGGLWETTRRLSDLAVGQRWTLPVAYTMFILAGDRRKQFAALLQSAPEDKYAEEEARRHIVENGSVLYLMIEAKQRRKQAEHALYEATIASPYQEQLLALLTQHASPYLGK